MSKELHIVAFDIPLPAVYGGVIDVFYKIKALAALNFKITLHCFQYGSRKQQETLNDYCSNVYYYERSTGIRGVSTHLPYIVYSRKNSVLLDRLKSTKAPILFEGLHTCYYLNSKYLAHNLKVVRTHNIEHEYYNLLGNSDSTFKKFYFKEESRRLKKFESVLQSANVILAISQTDHLYFTTHFKNSIVRKLTPFHSNDKVQIVPGRGNYILYHGSLGNPENEKSALFLINEVAARIQRQVIIAGSNPTPLLTSKCKCCSNVRLIANPNEQELETLIRNAHIHLLYASQKSGMKLKFLKTLYNGRHIIANSLMATEDNLKESVHTANTGNEWLDQIEKLYSLSFTEEMINRRKHQLIEYSNSRQALILSDLILQNH